MKGKILILASILSVFCMGSLDKKGMEIIKKTYTSTEKFPMIKNVSLTEIEFTAEGGIYKVKVPEGFQGKVENNEYFGAGREGTIIFVKEEQLKQTVPEKTPEEIALSTINDNYYPETALLVRENDLKTQGYAIYKIGNEYVLRSVTVFDGYYVTLEAILPGVIGHDVKYLPQYKDMVTSIGKI